jgi:poly-D-alanine transfer protein DltD
MSTIKSEKSSLSKVPDEVKEKAKYAASSKTGKVPSDVVIKVERQVGRPANHLSKEIRSAKGKKARRKQGTKYTPTDDDYGKIEEMVTIGLDQHTIAKIMGISNATLTKYYKHTLSTAREKRTASVAGVAYKMAMSGESASMTTFWLKTQGGWTPKQHIVHEDRNFDISWSDDEDDIADANRRGEVNIH